MDRSVAYAAYVLAKAGRMDKARLRYLHDDRLNRIESPLARAQIGAALYMIGDNARSKSAFDQGGGRRSATPTRATTTRRRAATSPACSALAAGSPQTDRVRRLSRPRGAGPAGAGSPVDAGEGASCCSAANALSGGQPGVNVGVAGQADAVTQGRVFKLRRHADRHAADVHQQWPGPAVGDGGGARLARLCASRRLRDGLVADKQLWTPGGARHQRQPVSARAIA